MAEIVPINPDGPKLRVDIRCGHAQAGAYIVKLWEGNEVVQREEGTFFDPSDDSYDLQGTAAKQLGRLLQCSAELEIIPPIQQFALLVTIWQGDRRVAVLTASGETEEPQVMRSLYARFTAEEAE